MKTPKIHLNKNESGIAVDVLNELLRRFGCTAEEAAKVIKGIKIENPVRDYVDPLEY